MSELECTRHYRALRNASITKLRQRRLVASASCLSFTCHQSVGDHEALKQMSVRLLTSAGGVSRPCCQAAGRKAIAQGEMSSKHLGREIAQSGSAG